jgi:hypothetical protein
MEMTLTGKKNSMLTPMAVIDDVTSMRLDRPVSERTRRSSGPYSARVEGRVQPHLLQTSVVFSTGEQ